MELTVISGKGGTGKTTIALALSELAKDAVKTDCDVDAPNLYLFYDGRDVKKEYFYGEKKAVIDKKFCTDCKECEKVCQFDAIKDGIVNPFKCEGCGVCTLVCPQKAIGLKEEKTADVYITQTNKGIISRAQMEVGSEGSGKLITQLRSNARKFSDENTLIIIDGSPGIGCPVISSITGSDAVLIVTEPTQSGLEDFVRVMELCRHFGVLTLVCINKYDINEKVAEEIEGFCRENDVYLIGKIPYDDTVMKSINELKPIVYYEGSKANQAIRQMWDNICKHINCLNQ
ncbi:MinD superfamily P-loop ATPase, contains an inserted ferredoxin domain [Caldanaerobius fijiensis DSM 17918]|uniref:MinD superfamily P-loop ATPase, contains an inserted ferredoxin domain n=1 Tax=Caldanaerobius fijiensis DSM 17918 TaxID=1121256 RepID=A0A1M5DSG3_9THEO|nr:ATP-binding protein [Caldanaerobius fijiensis]SHF69875.1 MinD superfamily P-loop ATPase, contains an inserted ferredoxin domain [Caldanaerobius fijiensis DSM 17918]